MKKKMLAVAVCVSMCMMAFAGCTSESGGGSDKKAEQTEGKKEESGKVFMTVSNQQNEFMVGMAENFKEVGEAAGYEVQLMDADLELRNKYLRLRRLFLKTRKLFSLNRAAWTG